MTDDREARVAQAKAQTAAAVAAGKCPLCGRPIRRNLSLTGWYQCSQLGAEQFRADPTKPPCSWQGFV
jgi:DNA repair exonuclease SbcCD ATPase subunit